MSGQQIGTIVGGVIGSFIPVVGTQLGAVIGGMIGGWVDPTKIYGPKLTDAQNQTAMDGVPRAYGYGRFPCKGNVIWRDPKVKQHKHKDDGKGSGQEHITFTYTRSSAVAICKGPISGILLVEENQKVVFDARTDAELLALGYTSEQIAVTRAAQAKFLQKAKFYYGTADQLPDPTMVAVKGVGNVPAYAGTAYMVMTDAPTIKGEIAQYRFVVANCGDRTEDDIDYIPVKWDVATETGGALDYDGEYTIRGASNTAGFITADRFVNSGDWYWESTTGWYLNAGSLINHSGQAGIIRKSDDATGLVISQLVGGQPDGGALASGEILFANQLLYPDWVPPKSTPRTALIRNRLTFSDGGATWNVAIDDGEWNVIMAGVSGEFAPYARSRGTWEDGGISEKDVTIYSMPDDFTYEVPEDALPLSAAPLSIGIPLPDAPGYYVDPETGEITGPGGTTIDVCTPTLGSIVSRQCAKRISTDVIDVSELTDLVTGFRVAAPSSPQKNIGALMPGYFFDGSEFDGKLRFPKRGGEDSFALTIDDLCERDGDLIQWETKQEPELLRKVTVGYLDPDTTYTATTQQWERRSGTVKAEGEGVLEFPVVETKDWAAQAAHKSVKVGWAEADECTFDVSIARADLVTAAVGTITDEKGTVHRVRIERIEDEGLRRMIHARRTRADVYESTVEGAAKQLPLFPGSNIRGPTDGLLLNLPVMVDSNDVPGIAWAASGFLSGWVGGTLQFLRAGQWTDAGTVTLPSTMGTLLDPLPAHAGDVDTTNTLHLRMSGSLESVTFTNLLQERNPLAILYPDGTAEILQFQTATEVAAGEYELTTLLRGRLATVPGDHASGARAVFLDSSVQYATLQPTDVGTTLTYRFVSQGTDPDAAPVQTLDLTTMQSQTEWPVADLAVEQDGDDYVLTWLARDRLGTDVFPIRSTHWRGYQVSWSYGGNTHTETVLTETATFNLPGASDITFSVAQLNLYTGAGPAQTVNIP